MNEDIGWTLEFYVAENGKSPVDEFLNDLDKKTRFQLRESFDLLKELNIQAKEPIVKHIEDKLWEYRKRIGTNAYRVFYMTFTGKRIVLLHAFLKKTQKTPRKELDMAKKRLARYLATHRGGN